MHQVDLAEFRMSRQQGGDTVVELSDELLVLTEAGGVWSPGIDTPHHSIGNGVQVLLHRSQACYLRGIGNVDCFGCTSGDDRSHECQQYQLFHPCSCS